MSISPGTDVRCTIGQASARTGLSAKRIRHYEAIGLLGSAQRSSGNYRLYDAQDLHRLRFIERARRLGFSIPQIEILLGLWQQQRPSREVKAVALAHVADLDQRIREMQALRDTLSTLAAQCHGDLRTECPILADLAASEGH